MEIRLSRKPLRPKIIEGFPGFGLIGTISTEFLIDHLKAEKIGSFHYTELPATVAVHGGRIVDPMGVFYSREHNLVILHTILDTIGLEWAIAENINRMAKELRAAEIIGLEGVSSLQKSDSGRVFFYSTSSKTKEKLEKAGLYPLKESVIVGVSGAMLLRSAIPVTCFLGETKTETPDSRAAAGIIKALDEYLNLKVDYRPLLKQAQEVEEKFKSIMKQSSAASKIADKKRLDYLG
ncbi:TPA: proteasome assembly chaperone family protein [Candidatus Woesearchaeota archaeon]|nr:3-isopropylmalate dehydratase [archaeon GW2011_AR15]MBS3104463.1 proteasome assembly chaperone family protein [Candidatus Woesearchaeota archaeon]HIH41223.1 proteasome assembly chaperone family protein [Candidatus Woesearchaeota archaeon]